MTPRGSSGFSLVVGVDKPAGLSSHDVVNRCRTIFGERRVGHVGTLDPAATGVMLLCVGPATRLDAYLTAQRKTYEATIVFGTATDTDDAEGRVIREGAAPDEVADPVFALGFMRSLEGTQSQTPPAFSAVKIAGKKAYAEARRGNIIDLKPRKVQVYRAEIQSIDGLDGRKPLSWTVEFEVSKGTYIRALARDIGNALNCPAHLGSLRRTKFGSVDLDACYTLEELERFRDLAALDPVTLLGFRFAFLDDGQAQSVSHGNELTANALTLFRVNASDGFGRRCSCLPRSCTDACPPEPGELIGLVYENKLLALYGFNERVYAWRARCVFAKGVCRGRGV